MDILHSISGYQQQWDYFTVKYEGFVRRRAINKPSGISLGLLILNGQQDNPGHDDGATEYPREGNSFVQYKKACQRCDHQRAFS